MVVDGLPLQRVTAAEGGEGAQEGGREGGCGGAEGGHWALGGGWWLELSRGSWESRKMWAGQWVEREHREVREWGCGSCSWAEGGH